MPGHAPGAIPEPEGGQLEGTGRPELRIATAPRPGPRRGGRRGGRPGAAIPEGGAVGAPRIDPGPRSAPAGPPAEVRSLWREVSRQLRAGHAPHDADGPLRAILDHTDAVIYMKDDRGRYLLINRRWADLFHTTLGRVVGKTDRELFPGPIADGFTRNDRRVLETGATLECEEIAPHDDGPHTYVSVKTPLLDASGRPYALCGISTDITGRRRAEEALRESRERLVAALEASGTGTYRWDLRTGAVDQDEQLRRLYGFPPGSPNASNEELLGRIHPEDRAALIERAQRCATEGADFSMEYRVVWPDGGVHWLDSRGKTACDASGRPLSMTGACVDITDRKDAEARLAHQATHDALTGLPNRVRLHQEVERAADPAGAPFALLLLDLDRFKEINDTFGHHVGDEVLRGLSPRLQALVGDSGLVARLGGDEFAILLPGAGREQAWALAERVVAALRRPIVVQHRRLDIGGSLGIALGPEHGRGPIELLRHADIAMYAAKRSHAGFAVYSAQLDQSSPRRLALRGDLRRAIDGGQLRLHYQPKLATDGLRVVGVEALVRWEHPREGLLMPGQFLPLAEESGLIRPLDLWCLGEALRQCRAWGDRGLDLGVAVNLAVDVLRDPDLADRVEGLLAETGTPPGRLTLEITEGAMMADPAGAAAVLGRLRARGVRVAIDDFGTGYSSLAYLRSLPADELKIDRAFIRTLAVDARDARIVRSIIALAHDLDFRVVAEGVEDRATLDRLAELGCDVVQGYHTGRPMPPDEFLGARMADGRLA